MMAAYARTYDRDVSNVPYRMDGKTELQITHELLGMAGLTRQEVTDRLPVFWEHYRDELERRLTPDKVTVHPGVREVVAALRARRDAVLGLLTGNCEAAARFKLAMAGLDGFAVAAYGAHHEAREHLPTVAVRDAQRVAGKAFQGKDIVIIGDTPNDVLCGRALGVKAIGVATGRFSPEELRAYAPDYVFANLSDVPAVLRAIDAP